MEIRDHKDLTIWKRSLDLVEDVYKVTKKFPQDEWYGLTNQLRRAAVSIPSNIAEGHERIHKADYLRFLSMSRGSIAEVETQILIAGRLNLLETASVDAVCHQLNNLGRMMNGLICALKRNSGASGIKEESPGYGTRDHSELTLEEVEYLTPEF